jgi:large subunit ribosomal protein L5
MQNLKEKYIKEVVPKMMKGGFGYTSIMAVPRIKKVVINIGIGKVRDQKETVEVIVKQLTMIAGQSIAPRPAKQAMASFKTRQGMVIGYKTTLRGLKMYDFLSRLTNLAIPRMRDFRGIPLKGIDAGGNLTLGVKEHIIFPEMIGENIKDIFGFEVTVVTNAKSREEAIELFRGLGFPLQKQ